MSKIKIGTDFEWMLLKRGEYYPAIDIIDGTKDDPMPISKDGHFLQVDNVLIEGNVPPSDEDNCDELIKNIRFVTNYVDGLFAGSPMSTEFKSSAHYDPSVLQHPDALRFGCDLTYNAWTGDVNPTPNPDTTLRTAAFHIHVGYENHTVEQSQNIARAMDLMLGLPSLLMDPDTERRELYGKAGEIRYPAHGVEYRVLGSYFLKSDELIRWVFETAVQAVKYGMENTVDDADIQYAIDNHDLVLAKSLMEKYSVTVSV